MSRPADVAQFYAAALGHFVLDHLEALATVLPNVQVGPVWVQWSLLRPIVDTAPRAIWINDRGIDTATRVRRAIALRRAGLNQQDRHPPSMRSGTDVARRRLNKYEQEMRWQHETPEVVPTAREHFGRLVLGETESGDLGSTIWHLTSGTIHGDSWSLTLPLDAHMTRVEDQVMLGEMVARSADCFKLLTIGALAAHRVVVERLHYLGVQEQDATTLVREWNAVRQLLRPYYPSST